MRSRTVSSSATHIQRTQSSSLHGVVARNVASSRQESLRDFTICGVGEGPSARVFAAASRRSGASFTRRAVQVQVLKRPLKISVPTLKAATVVQECPLDNHVEDLSQFLSPVEPNERVEFQNRFSTARSYVASRALLPRVLLVLSLLLFCAPRLFGAVHPVPLDPKADTATCLECHEDKTKGKFVHSAIQMGCTSCHEVRVNKDITRVKLITSTPQALCLTCHADKDAATLKGTVHPPAVRDCIKCHDPHESDNKNQLLKADQRR